MQFVLAESMTKALSSLLSDHGLILLVRHSVRPPLPEGEVGEDVRLNEVGINLAKQLGRKIQGKLLKVVSSPMLRCVETGDFVRARDAQSRGTPRRSGRLRIRVADSRAGQSRRDLA